MPAPFIAAIAGSAFLKVVTTVLLTVVLAALQRSIAPRPPTLDPLREQGRQINARSANTTRVSVYGRQKMGGTIAYIGLTGTDNQFLHIVLTLADHETHGPVAYFLDDNPVYPSQLDANGNVTSGRYFSNGEAKLRIRYHNGTDDQVADSALVSEVTEWTADHRGRGVSYVYFRLKFDRDVFVSVPRLTCELKGKKIEDVRVAGSPNTVAYTNNAALVLRDWLKSEVGLSVPDSAINDSLMAAAANTSDEEVTVLDDPTHEHTFPGSAAGVDTANDLIILNSDDVCRFVDGDIVQVTTTGTLPTGISASTDYYVNVVRLLKSVNLDETVDLRPAISLHTTAAGAHQSLPGAPVSIVNITGTGSGTHTVKRVKVQRYTADGPVNADRKPKDVLSELLSAMSGSIAFIGGEWKLRDGAYVAPTIELNEDDMRGAISLQSRRSRRERFNAVKGLYVNPANNYQPTDYPAYQDDQFFTDDGNVRLYSELPLQFTNSAPKAIRLAKIALLRHRQEITVTLRCKLSALQVEAGDRVQITNTELGWTQKVFDVIDVTVQNAGTEQAPYIGVDLSLRETASTVFDWSAASDETGVDPAPNTNLPNPTNIPVITGLTVDSGESVLWIRNDGTVFSTIKASWDAVTNPYVDTIEVQFKKTADSAWMTHNVLDVSAVSAFITEVEEGVQYDVRVRSISVRGVRSPYASVFSHLVQGHDANPSPPDAFTVGTDAVGTRVFRWEHANPDSDTAGYKIRFASGLGNTDFDTMSDLFGGLNTRSPIETNELAAGPWSFGIKAVDRTGNLSSALYADATLPDPNLENALLFRDEKADGWPGVKEQCAVLGDGTLVATGTGTIADLPATIAALPATVGELTQPYQHPMRYTTAEYDLGADINFTVLPSLSSNGVELVEMQVGTDADGSSEGAGSPSNDWVQAGQALGRYIKVRFTINDLASPSIRLVASAFSFIVDAPSRIESFDNIDISTFSATYFERLAAGHFRIGSRGALASISDASLVLVNTGGGFTYDLISKTAQITSGTVAAEFKVYNASNVLADATVDILLRGPTS